VVTSSNELKKVCIWQKQSVSVTIFTRFAAVYLIEGDPRDNHLGELAEEGDVL